MTNKIALLGSTGSIGTQVLEIVRRFPERFTVDALAAGRNLAVLAEQVREFRPCRVAVQEAADIPAFRERLRVEAPYFRGEILSGPEGLGALAEAAEVTTVIVGLVGLIGLSPSLRALKTGKKLLTANKETFVAGGHLVQPWLDRIIPIDSEHVAVHQCLQGSSTPGSGRKSVRDVRRIYLTASGGPFRTLDAEQMRHITVEDALKHPNWVMGRKITIDSATLMNKGLEVIEAHWLFGLPYERIEVVVHPESLIHGGVEFVDGSTLLQMGVPDMRGPIQYAMTYPERLPDDSETTARLDLATLSRLSLEPPDPARFPCLRLAYEAGRLGGGATAVLNGADEEAVRLFLDREIAFTDIPRLLEATLDAYTRENIPTAPSLPDILSLDAWARGFVRRTASSRRPPVLSCAP
jgi:1-deoxy-D-xylulose-5-phosphate reductoisomerase